MRFGFGIGERSRGLKPAVLRSRSVRAEARTYLRRNSRGNGKCNDLDAMCEKRAMFGEGMQWEHFCSASSYERSEL
jgi:hypothetical protein